jgi:hypothetical protein
MVTAAAFWNHVVLGLLLGTLTVAHMQTLSTRYATR